MASGDPTPLRGAPTIAVTQHWAVLHIKHRGHMHQGGANDLWVASSALAADPVLPLATNNLNDFEAIAAGTSLRLVHPDLPDGEVDRHPTVAGDTV